jgi:hypothetical protein
MVHCHKIHPVITAEILSMKFAPGIPTCQRLKQERKLNALQEKLLILGALQRPCVQR